MTPEQLQYLRRAVEALESGECTAMTQHKILRTVEQICGKCATDIEKKMVDTLDDIVYNVKTVKGATNAELV